jgi:small GTP-binding protein
MNKIQTISILNYKKTVLALKESLQKLSNFSQQLGLTEISEQSQHLSQKLADNSFGIAVFGEFNKGKSTFINALIGQEVLPADILATTATITRIIHKRYIGAKICFKNGHEKDIPLKELTNYITKLSENSTARSANIKEAIISYPLPFAQENHIEIVDTPGLNDDAEMTGRTLSIIQNCDIAIMVISAQTPFSMSEVEFLKKLLNQGIAKILFVVNQIDLYSSIDAQRIIEMIDKKLGSSGLTVKTV